MIQMQLMEATAPSNIPGMRVGGLSHLRRLTDVCRLHGVTEDVYSEGTHFRVHVHPASLVPFNIHTVALDSMARDTHSIRHSSEAEEYRKPDGHKRFGTVLQLRFLRISYRL